MHQTFYIDIDEEITSIIERLRKSTAKEVVIVVPKRALLIQSIINLKLMKKEADGLGKKIIIVTQDKFGKLIVEKTGIAVEQRLNDVSGEEMIVAEKAKKDNFIETGEEQGLGTKQKLKNRLDAIGSPGFFDNSENKVKEKEVNLGIKKEEIYTSEKLINKELVTDISGSMKSKKRFGMGEVVEKAGAADMIKNIDITQKGSSGIEAEAEEGYLGGLEEKKSKKSLFRKAKMGFGKSSSRDVGFETANQKDDSNFYQKQYRDSERKGSEDYKSANLSKKARKFFAIFGFVAATIIFVLLVYLFLPKATVTIFAKAKIQSLDIEMKADTKANSADIEKKIIPAEAITVDEEISRSFDSTGTTGASSHKARGMLTIYNEYSPAPQPLVATTRFLSEDGKLFRLVNGVTVPGTTKVGEEIKPGAIEAEVVADEAGEGFNIGPSRFTIPGFQGSGNEKYSKIYAKSGKTMNGGATVGLETVRTVTDADINSAKSKILSEMNSLAKQKIKDRAGDGTVVLDDALSVGDPAYKASNSVGEVADSFTVTLKISVNAIVFKDKDLQDVVKSVLAKGAGTNYKIVDDSVKAEFGKSDADFAGSALTLRLHATGKLIPNLDLESIRKGILGKNEQELEVYLKAFPDVARAEVSYWPVDISGRIPSYESRVEISLDNN